MDPSREPLWSDAVDEADWIGEGLSPGESVTSVVPGGYQAYARVLHPVEAPHEGDVRVFRWRDIGAWSGTPLTPDSQFHSIALPPTSPDTDAPWRKGRPAEGALTKADATALADIVRGHTETPERCWFCLWDGYGWDNTQLLAPTGQPSAPLPDPVPAHVRNGPRVRLPGRDYFLYRGAVEAVLASSHLAEDNQTPNLWWPADRSWCVASEIDLVWTYVGGSAELIEQVLADGRIEAVPAEPNDALTRVEGWVIGWVDSAVAELLKTGTATIVTSQGTVRARMRRPGRFRRGELRTERIIDGRVVGNGGYFLDEGSDESLRETGRWYLTHQVLDLVEG